MGFTLPIPLKALVASEPLKACRERTAVQGLPCKPLCDIDQALLLPFPRVKEDYHTLQLQSIVQQDEEYISLAGSSP